jgi:hypothetical protein
MALCAAYQRAIKPGQLGCPVPARLCSGLHVCSFCKQKGHGLEDCRAANHFTASSTEECPQEEHRPEHLSEQPEPNQAAAATSSASDSASALAASRELATSSISALFLSLSRLRTSGHYIRPSLQQDRPLGTKTQPPARLASGHKDPASSKTGLWAL